jgi:hypothetical protein
MQDQAPKKEPKVYRYSRLVDRVPGCPNLHPHGQHLYELPNPPAGGPYVMVCTGAAARRAHDRPE